MSKRSYDLQNKLWQSLIPVLAPGVLVPVGLALGTAIHGVQALSYLRASRRMRGQIPCAPPEATREGPGSMADIVPRLGLEDFKPIPLDGFTSTMLRATVDMAPMYLDTVPRARGSVFRYPSTFHASLIPGYKGVPISAYVGLHHAMLPRPTLVVVHGLLNSKQNDLVRVLALKAYYEWGFNVCAVDLRGFGQSASFMSVPTAGGGLEAQDLLEVVRYLKRFPNVTTVGMLGFSLGGGAVLNAAGLPGREVRSLLDGGVMAVCPPLDFEQALQRLETPPEEEAYLFTFHALKHLLDRMVDNADILRWARKKGQAEGANVDDIHSLRDYMTHLVAWGYLGRGVQRDREHHTPEHLYRLLMRLTSPMRALSRVRVPTFLLVAKDDPLTRLNREQRATVTRMAEGNPHLHVHETSHGGHCAYQLVAHDWFYEVIHRFFSYWAEWPVEKAHPFPA